MLWILDGDNTSLNARSQHKGLITQSAAVTGTAAHDHNTRLSTQSVAVTEPPPLLHAERVCGGTPHCGIARTPWASICISSNPHACPWLAGLAPLQEAALQEAEEAPLALQEVGPPPFLRLVPTSSCVL